MNQHTQGKYTVTRIMPRQSPWGHDTSLVFLCEVFLKIAKGLKTCFSGISVFPMNHLFSKPSCISPLPNTDAAYPSHKYLNVTSYLSKLWVDSTIPFKAVGLQNSFKMNIIFSERESRKLKYQLVKNTGKRKLTGQGHRCTQAILKIPAELN